MISLETAGRPGAVRRFAKNRFVTPYTIDVLPPTIVSTPSIFTMLL